MDTGEPIPGKAPAETIKVPLASEPQEQQTFSHSSENLPKVERYGESGIISWRAEQRAVLLDHQNQYAVEASLFPAWADWGIILDELKIKQEAQTPFSVVTMRDKGGGKISLVLRPTRLADLPQETKSPKPFFQRDQVTFKFVADYERESKGKNPFVDWMRGFIGGLKIETMDDVAKAETVYTALLHELDGPNGPAINKLLLNYLQSTPVQEVAAKSGHRFREDENEPVCQHLASLLSFTFSAAGIEARNTRVYSEEYQAGAPPRGVVLVETTDKSIKGVDPLTSKLLDSPLEGIHSWTEAMINNRLVPFDLTWDVGHSKDPMFCGELPPIKLDGSNDLARQAPGGKLFHVYPIEIIWANIQSINEVSI